MPRMLPLSKVPNGSEFRADSLEEALEDIERIEKWRIQHFHTPLERLIDTPTQKVWTLKGEVVAEVIFWRKKWMATISREASVPDFANKES